MTSRSSLANTDRAFATAPQAILAIGTASWDERFTDFDTPQPSR
jgi:hypothetical protein